ncbi:VOC family protein [Thalassotalea sp. G2M2-11]|uniref:VOC family protein n=1 Tax=Thalassotalea sp. G2M2-11 TaxID=2787627 RepID=UPI0019D1FE9D|nr:VOC family protein [Thalassotalea sp. G2M2-11]
MTNKIGDMAWLDLTVANAEEVKNFYQDVIGWQSEAVSMGDYQDFTMLTEDKQAVSGICHAKGSNADLPPMWLPYFLVADIEQSVAQVKALGGKLLTPINTMGNDKYVVINDPAGAACALYQKG